MKLHPDLLQVFNLSNVLLQFSSQLCTPEPLFVRYVDGATTFAKFLTKCKILQEFMKATNVPIR